MRLVSLVTQASVCHNQGGNEYACGCGCGCGCVSVRVCVACECVFMFNPCLVSVPLSFLFCFLVFFFGCSAWICVLKEEQLKIKFYK